MSSSELAEKAGIHRNTLSGYEQGKRSLDDETFVRLCLHLGLDVAEVFAAACLAKLELDLRPLETRKRGELGLPSREPQGRDRLPAEQHSELLHGFLAEFGKYMRFTFEHFSDMGSHRRTLIHLRPDSLQDPYPDRPKQKRARKSRKAKPKGTARKGKAPAPKGEGS